MVVRGDDAPLFQEDLRDHHVVRSDQLARDERRHHFVRDIFPDVLRDHAHSWGPFVKVMVQQRLLRQQRLHRKGIRLRLQAS